MIGIGSALMLFLLPALLGVGASEDEPDWFNAVLAGQDDELVDEYFVSSDDRLLGEKTMAVVRITTSWGEHTQCDIVCAHNLMFGEELQYGCQPTLDRATREASGGRMWYSEARSRAFDVSVPDTDRQFFGGCDWTGLARQAWERLLAENEVDVHTFDFTYTLLPNGMSCPFAGVAFMPGWHGASVNGYARNGVVKHEVGHNYGLPHQRARLPQEGHNQGLPDNGGWDSGSSMGGGVTFSTADRYVLGWVSGSAVHDLGELGRQAGSQELTIASARHPFDTPHGPLTVSFVHGGSRFVLTYRTPHGTEAAAMRVAPDKFGVYMNYRVNVHHINGRTTLLYGTGTAGDTLEFEEPVFQVQIRSTDNDKAVVILATPQVTTTTVPSGLTPQEEAWYSPAMSAYWDHGACGRMSDDYNMGWCGHSGACPQIKNVPTSTCPTGRAQLKFKKTGVIYGCNYYFYAQYACEGATTTSRAMTTTTTSTTTRGDASEGWELIARQANSDSSLFTSGAIGTFLENPLDPNAETFMKVGSLDWSQYDEAGKYMFKLVWGGGSMESGDISRVVTWLQSSQLTEATITDFEEVGNSGYTDGDGCTAFKGLGKSDASSHCVIDGNAGEGCWWNCVGAIAKHAGGIPGPKGRIAKSSALYIRHIRPTTTTTTTTMHNRETWLTAYFDLGSCGPHGNNHHWDWCNRSWFTCAATVPVPANVCSAEVAKLVHTRIFTKVDDCAYAYHAQYECVASSSSSHSRALSVASDEASVTDTPILLL